MTFSKAILEFTSTAQGQRMKREQRRPSKSTRPQVYEIPQDLQNRLVDWYRTALRPLPWRQDRDPYRIWISEVMLQQTTVQAVIPFYERFMIRFPTASHLAESSLEEVYEFWAGLGYYSRARNLHKAAQVLANNGFPQSHAKLVELPGFGPYTSRAVASLAFSEKVGVLDGNVIRFLSRHWGIDTEWWKPNERASLQGLSDRLAQIADPHLLNQAMMELGATICTPKNPTCLLCPLNKSCVAFAEDRTGQLPRSRPQMKKEYWQWEPLILQRKDKIALVQNQSAPFLKNSWIFPGSFKKMNQKPKKFDLQHSITKFNIFVKVQRPKSGTKTGQLRWVAREQLKQVNPSSLLHKILGHLMIALALTITFGCQTKSPISALILPAQTDPLVATGARPVTFIGQNSSPHLLSTGDRLLFVSRERPQHRNAQIYEFNFLSQTERRVTFHDGDDFDPRYSSPHEFFYSSTTDEIKESLLTKEQLADSQMRREIYSSDFFGNDITRWTHQPGTDRNAVTLANPKRTFYIQELGKDYQIHWIQEPNQKPHLFYSTSNPILLLNSSRDGRLLIWVERTDGNRAVALKAASPFKVKAQDIQTLHSLTGDWQFVGPGAQDNQWLLSEKAANSQDYSLLLFDAKQNCRQTLLSIPGYSFYNPTTSKSNLLVFTRKHKDNEQIYVMEWPKNLGPCL